MHATRLSSTLKTINAIKGQSMRTAVPGQNPLCPWTHEQDYQRLSALKDIFW
jgi:hypothetical protein